MRVGPLAVQMHNTAGHTPGSTTWTWQSCVEGKCLNLVYADSISAIAAPGFRFTGEMPEGSTATDLVLTVTQMLRKKGVVGKFVEFFGPGLAGLTLEDQATIANMITTHPMATDLAGKLKKRAAKPAADPFIDPQACRALAANAMKALDARVAEESKK